ncbi:hypothetical protein, partial [Bradyrhizobium vignae]|uniref:hypothetical protein n=1 Tax=Bradyrhizobium vignae TaxID=1549949 RepID=UPI001ABEF877
GQSVGRMIEQHRRLQVEWIQQPSVWPQTWSLSTPHGIFASLAMTEIGAALEYVTGREVECSQLLAAKYVRPPAGELPEAASYTDVRA